MLEKTDFFQRLEIDKKIATKTFLIVSCAVIFFLSLFLRSLVDIGADTGIYLNIAKKIAHGGKYYYDFFESNFPLSFYFYYLQYQIAQILGLSQIILSEIVINSLALLAIFWSAKILKKTTIYHNKSQYNLIIISYFLGFFLRPYGLEIAEFGTKTSLLLILFYPYLSFCFVREKAFTKCELIQRGILMGLIPCLKPHYLILILFLELRCFFFAQAKTYLDKIVMILIGEIYLLLMLKFTPEFFEFIVPMWPKIYSVYDNFGLFLENIWVHLGRKIAIFSLIILIFSRLKFDKNDLILILSFCGASILMICENIGTLDQNAGFFAIITIVFVKFTYDLIKSRQISFYDHKFVILSLVFIPIFQPDFLYLAVFGFSGIINLWWFVAFIYSLFLLKNSKDETFKIKLLLKFYPIFFLLLFLTIFTFKIFGFFAFIAINIFSLSIILFFFEPKFFPKFSIISIIAVISAISCFFYAYISAIYVAFNGGGYDSARQVSDKIAYYYQAFAPKKDDKVLIISDLNAHRFPLLNYLEKNDNQKYHIASIFASEGSSGDSKMFSSYDRDEILTLTYLIDDIKNQMHQSKLIMINNGSKALNSRESCLIGALEYYFMDNQFRKFFLENFRFENRLIISDLSKKNDKKIAYDFEIYRKK